VTPAPLASATEIRLEIRRSGERVFDGSTPLSSMKRDVKTLVEYLYRDNSFPNGCFLPTGTGIVPPDTFTLLHGDEIRIGIDGIGTLVNFVGLTSLMRVSGDVHLLDPLQWVSAYCNSRGSWICSAGLYLGTGSAGRWATVCTGGLPGSLTQTFQPAPWAYSR
jgi:hypothetical protein